jgi:MFS family permease
MSRVFGNARRAWLVVALLWFVAALNYLDRLMITTMRDPIVSSIPMSDARFGLLTSVFLWVYGILSPVGGYCADRFGKRRVIVVSLFVWSGITLATGLASSFSQLLTARAIMGLSEACYIPAALALISDHHCGRTRSLATGLHMSGVYAGAALGGLGGYIAEFSSWRRPFFWFGLAGLLYSLVLILFLKDAPALPADLVSESRIARKPGMLIRSLFLHGGFWALLLINALVGMANWSVNGWLPSYLKDHFHLGLGRAGLSATGYIQIASFIGVICGGLWADRWAARNRMARALVPAIGYCVAGPVLLFTAGDASFAVAISGLIIFGVARGLFDTNHMPILRQLVDERASATGYGVLNCVSCGAGGLMIYAAGRIKDAQIGLEKIFQFSAVGLFIVGLMLLLIKFPRGAERSAVEKSS